MTALIYPPSLNATQKTLGAQLLAGATSAATLNNVTGIQNKLGMMVIDRVDTNGVETPSKREYIKFAGTSGSTVVTLTRNADGSGTDQDHAIGAVVEFIPDVVWAQAINDVITAEHSTAGIHDSTKVAVYGSIDTTKLVDLTTAQALTHKDLTDATNSFPTTILTTTGTQTVTNKTLKPRVLTADNYTTDTGTSLNCDNYDYFEVTAQAGALKFNNPSGTPYNGQKLWLSVTGTAARALTYDTQYESSAAAVLPTTTVTTARIDIGLIWRADTSKWHCVAVA